MKAERRERKVKEGECQGKERCSYNAEVHLCQVFMGVNMHPFTRQPTTYPGIPDSDKDVIKELVYLLVEECWSVDG